MKVIMIRSNKTHLTSRLKLETELINVVIHINGTTLNVLHILWIFILGIAKCDTLYATALIGEKTQY